MLKWAKNKERYVTVEEMTASKVGDVYARLTPQHSIVDGCKIEGLLFTDGSILSWDCSAETNDWDLPLQQPQPYNAAGLVVLDETAQEIAEMKGLGANLPVPQGPSLHGLSINPADEDECEACQ